MSLVRVDPRRLLRADGAWTELIHFTACRASGLKKARQRITGGLVGITDISLRDWSALRDARKDATLCPDCKAWL